MYRAILATVPIRCRSTGSGSAISAFRCITMPTGFCSLTALCAAMTDRGRPSAIGSTVPGNSTRPRTGTMISASAGNGGEGAAARDSSEAVGASVIRGPRLLQRDQQAALEFRPMNRAIAARGQTDAALKAALRQFEAVDDRRPHRLRVGPAARDQQFALVDDRLDLVEIDPRQSDQRQHRALRLEDI